ncbi:glycoside hydrolase family 16 protein [Thalassotalea sp. PS06]|uniref:glycoside hydrolase family 16 protein n=1 Tax=Thalassotalea sp. PS06 TaxID=2594005 RepID=UPI0021B09086|nr:glycoside hydrolase family 16 protein [Thalassotalea sp. PS06]
MINHQARQYSLLVTVVFMLTMSGCGGGGSENDLSDNNSSTPTPAPPQPSQPDFPTKVVTKSTDWQLLWQDEFDGPEINAQNWQFEQNCWGGGNNEKQCYTNRVDNAVIEQGSLHIIARKETFTGPAEQDDSPDYNDNITKTLPYTSARLRSKGLKDWRYGRVEIRAKLPHGQGTWPAIWMLPTDYVYGGWAASGEIDIMEAVNLGAASDASWAQPGDIETRVHGTLHYGGSWPNNVYSGQDFLQNGVKPWEDFHTYALEWQEGEIRWYMDDIHYATQTSDGWYSQYTNDSGVVVIAEDTAPFNQDFHLLLNVAIGGSWAENVNEKGVDSSITEARMVVDYVRVYQCSKDVATGKGCEAISEEAPIVAKP